MQHITRQLTESLVIPSEEITIHHPQPMATVMIKEIDVAEAAPINPNMGHCNEHDVLAIQ